MDPQPPKLPRGIRKTRPLHPCPQCRKTFTKRSNMLIHARLHTGETPYVCKFAGCGKSYKWLSSINFHEGRCEKRSAGLAVPAPLPPPPPAQAEAERMARARQLPIPPPPDLALRPDIADRLLPPAHPLHHPSLPLPPPGAPALPLQQQQQQPPRQPPPPNPPLHPALALAPPHAGAFPALPSYQSLQAHAAGASTPPPMHPHGYTGYTHAQSAAPPQTHAQSYSHGHGATYGTATYSSPDGQAHAGYGSASGSASGSGSAGGGAHTHAGAPGALAAAVAPAAQTDAFHTPRKGRRFRADAIAMPLSPVTPYAGAGGGGAAAVAMPLHAGGGVPALPKLKPLAGGRAAPYARIAKRRVKAEGMAVATDGATPATGAGGCTLNFAGLRTLKRARPARTPTKPRRRGARRAKGGKGEDGGDEAAPGSPESVTTNGVRDALAPGILIGGALVEVGSGGGGGGRCASQADLEVIGESFGMSDEDLFNANCSIVGSVFDELATDEYALSLDHCSPESESLSLF